MHSDVTPGHDHVTDNEIGRILRQPELGSSLDAYIPSGDLGEADEHGDDEAVDGVLDAEEQSLGEHGLDDLRLHALRASEVLVDQ